MTIVRVIHHVRDFEAWKPLFEEHQAVLLEMLEDVQHTAARA